MLAVGLWGNAEAVADEVFQGAAARADQTRTERFAAAWRVFVAFLADMAACFGAACVRVSEVARDPGQCDQEAQDRPTAGGGRQRAGFRVEATSVH
jgi:hypothetical protein